MGQKQRRRKMKEIKSSTSTLIEALRLIANGGIDDPEGVTTAAILEAADRLEELQERLKKK